MPIEVPVKLGKQDIAHVAELARLEITPDEVDAYTLQFNSILEYLDELNTLDTQGVAPMQDMCQRATPMRNDVPTPSMDIEDVLRNAPDRFDRFLLVPKVVDA